MVTQEWVCSVPGGVQLGTADVKEVPGANSTIVSLTTGANEQPLIT